MSLRLFAILPVLVLCACASSRPGLPRADVSAAVDPLPPEIKPLTMEQEEQANAMGAI